MLSLSLLVGAILEAKVKDGQAVANVTLAIRPITLTVGVETKLWLWVERGLTNTDHMVYARLVRAADENVAVGKQNLKLDVSGTVYTLTTNSSGYANQSLCLVAVGGQTTTYQIRAVFEGAGFKTINLTVTDPYGRNYAVCTTLQWDFRSSQNSVTLTVEAPKTDTTVSTPASPEDEVTVTQDDESTTVTIPPAKTPEQMQQYAIDLGWLKMWAQFSWSYPWFRTHAQLSVSLNGLDLWLHIGFNPVLPDEGVVEWSPDLAQLFASLQEEALTEMFIEIVGLIAMYFSAKGLSLLGRGAQPWLLAAALGIIVAKFSAQSLLLYIDWNDKVKMLAQGIVNTILAILVYFKIDVLLLFIESVAIGMSMSVVSALRAIAQKIGSMMGTISTAFSFLRDWVDIVEFAGDAILAAMSWVRFFQL